MNYAPYPKPAQHATEFNYFYTCFMQPDGSARKLIINFIIHRAVTTNNYFQNIVCDLNSTRFETSLVESRKWFLLISIGFTENMSCIC